tara:strand:- start:174 stop:545 length:372 start_codon:yes stop_codon:yes gene_type:complete
MKLETGKTYVFKDDAARDDFISMNSFNESMVVSSGGEFKVFRIKSDGDALVDSSHIETREFHLFKEKESEPFDISEYEFSDAIGIGTVQPDDKGDLIVNLNKGSWVHMDKQDVEVMAKHFKLI